MYTKHKWKSDRYYSFNYVKYLPKDYDEMDRSSTGRLFEYKFLSAMTLNWCRGGNMTKRR